MKLLQVSVFIAEDFSQFPGGRYISDGPNSAERFRDTLLVPLLKKFFFVTIYLDGTMGYGSSWLEEVFSGLVLKHGYMSSDLLYRLNFNTLEDSSLITEIKRYITNPRIR